MRNHVFKVGFFAAFLSVQAVPAELLFEDKFDAIQVLGGSSAGEWPGASQWEVPSGDTYVKVEEIPLTYEVEGGGVIDGGPRCLAMVNYPGQDVTLLSRKFPAYDGQEIYVRYLFRIPAGMHFPDEGEAGVWLGSSKNSFMIYKLMTPTNFTATVGGTPMAPSIPPKVEDEKTYLLVARYSKTSQVAGAPFNQVDFWVNPPADGKDDPQFTVLAESGNGDATFDRVGARLLLKGDGTGFVLGALAGATAWEDVVPQR